MSVGALTGNDAPGQLIVLENTPRTGLNVQGRHTHGVLGRAQTAPKMKGVCHPLARDKGVSTRIPRQFDINLRANLGRGRQRL
jgi:hypothetical protein